MSQPAIHTEVIEQPVLGPFDTCDRCGVPANTAIRLTNGGTLTFCNHDYDLLEPSLAPNLAIVTRRDVK